MGASRAALEAPPAFVEWATLQAEPPDPPGTTTPDSTSGIGSRALRFTVLILVARIASRLLALVAVVAIGNALGDSRFGQMQTAITYTALFVVITDVGFPGR